MASLIGLKFFEEMQTKYRQEEISDLLECAKRLGLSQKTISINLFHFFKSRQSLQLEPDNLTFYCAVIDLTGKMTEHVYPLERILVLSASVLKIKLEDLESKRKYCDAINATEIEIARIVDFDFDFYDYHSEMKDLCMRNGLDMETSKRAWIILNDITTFTPATIFFTGYEINHAALLVAYIYNGVNPSVASTPNSGEVEDFEVQKTTSNEEMIENFCIIYNVSKSDLDYIISLANIILKIYLGCKQLNRE